MKFIFAFFLLIFFYNVSLGQAFQGQDASDLISGANHVVLDESGSYSFISFYDSSAPKIETEEIPNLLNRLLSLSSTTTFKLKSNVVDKLAYSHLKYEQFQNDIFIEGSALTVHMLDGRIKSISGAYFYNIELISVQPSITFNQAKVAAKEYIGAEVYTDENQDELVILPLDKTFYLAIRITMKSAKPYGRNSVFVDANTGGILWSLSHIYESQAEGIAETRYSGERQIITEENQSGIYSLIDLSRGDGIITRDLNGNFFSVNAENIYNQSNYWFDYFYGADGSLDVHWGSEVTYDYFLDEFGRNSFDDNGAQIQSYVDYGIGQENAFWDGEFFFYGAGEGNVNPVTSLDVVAHEFTHAITQHTAGLYNSDQSGSLNESFSDIFGVVVDYNVRGAMIANYQIGEEVGGIGFRNLANPNSQNHPDTYLGQFWSYNSLGSPHINAGVQNYWFYLISEGGAGINDNGYIYSVNQIGIENAAEIAYRALTVYMFPFADYYDARMASIYSAIDLYGNCSPEVIAVTNAWAAVGVSGPFQTEVYAIPYILPSNACIVPAEFQFYDRSRNSLSYFWDFGDGQTSIEENPNHIYESAGSYDVTLTVEGGGMCLGTDQSVVFEIVVQDQGGPQSAACLPIGNMSGFFSISSFTINGVDLPVDYDSYLDFTCHDEVEMTEG